ncbi:tRNA (uracil-5-)-methyltransferase [Nematocida sp. AWRm80]|nr:tRNA (uracil-5-)-methyltransferase [Nematocida sp. AWRm80]
MDNLNPTTWLMHNLPKKLTRAELLEAVRVAVGKEEFNCSFKCNKRVGTLITYSNNKPMIYVRGKPVSVRKKEIHVREVRNIVTPLYHLSYRIQMERKLRKVREYIGKFSSAEVIGVESPDRMGYRNKCEFTFGYSEEGLPVLGFRPTPFVDAPNLVSSPENCTYNVSAEMLEIVKNINTTLAKTEDLVYDRIIKSGYLKVMMLRKINKTYTAVIQVNCETNKEAMEVPEIQEFVKTLPFSVYLYGDNRQFEGFGPGIKLALAKGTEEIPIQPLAGCEFKVSPLSFFQINTKVAEKMIEIIKENIQTSTILDLCCGSGTLGIAVSKGLDTKLYGIDISPSSIEDAQKNCEHNKIKGEYICGDIHKKLSYILCKIVDKTTALLDPPRAGITNRLMKRIIQEKQIEEIFYASCKYTAIKDNIQEICNYYHLQKAYVLDMFPFTDEIEVLYHFKRKTEQEIKDHYQKLKEIEAQKKKEDEEFLRKDRERVQQALAKRQAQEEKQAKTVQLDLATEPAHKKIPSEPKEQEEKKEEQNKQEEPKEEDKEITQKEEDKQEQEQKEQEGKQEEQKEDHLNKEEDQLKEQKQEKEKDQKQLEPLQPADDKTEAKIASESEEQTKETESKQETKKAEDQVEPDQKKEDPMATETQKPQNPAD